MCVQRSMDGRSVCASSGGEAANEKAGIDRCGKMLPGVDAEQRSGAQLEVVFPGVAKQLAGDLAGALADYRRSVAAVRRGFERLTAAGSRTGWAPSERGWVADIRTTPVKTPGRPTARVPRQDP